MAVNVLLEMERIMAEQNYVELRYVNKKYKDFQASDDINFGIGKGKLGRAARTEWQLERRRSFECLPD